ncbi:MAG: hypothetical protein ACOYOF_16080 [Verrucomicrobiaceae bacterium]
MIELHKDVIRFSFPAIAAELEDLIEGYIHSLLPSFLAEEREVAVEQFLDKSRALCSSLEYQTEVRKVASELSNADIETSFRKVVAGFTKAYGYNKPGRMEIEFQRTLRIPDDGGSYPLPPGLGRFPLRHLEDYGDRVPPDWLKRGGIIMAMYQAEALWLNFRGQYPMAIKIGAGKINAVTGELWQAGLNREPQDYVVVPDQPWLDGFAVEKGIIRQFVAMPLGTGYSVEEQLSGRAEFGGIQLQVHPLKASVFFDEEIRHLLPKRLADILPDVMPKWKYRRADYSVECCMAESSGMGLGAGGRMRQQIYADPFSSEDWETSQTSRCFVHLCNALVWREMTGENPPQTPVTAKEYERARLPWFDFYRDDLAILEGSKALASVLSVATIAKIKEGQPMLGNDSVAIPSVISCVTTSKEVTEWSGE